jgi:SAM-dependent methyltransferase
MLYIQLESCHHEVQESFLLFVIGGMIMNKIKDSISADSVESWMKNLENVMCQVNPDILDWAEQYGPGHIEHYKSVIENIRRINVSCEVESIVDIGSVPGHIPVMLKHFGLFVQAVDINPERAQKVFEAMDIPYYQVDIETECLPFEDSTQDLVLFCEVMEHLRNQPLNAIKEIMRVLKPGGNLLLSTPNITPLMRWRFLWGEDFQGNLIDELSKVETIGHMGHFRLYSAVELKRILRHYGFQIINVETGGKLSGHNGDWDARILRMLVPNLMRAQLYIWARK